MNLSGGRKCRRVSHFSRVLYLLVRNLFKLRIAPGQPWYFRNNPSPGGSLQSRRAQTRMQTTDQNKSNPDLTCNCTLALLWFEHKQRVCRQFYESEHKEAASETRGKGLQAAIGCTVIAVETRCRRGWENLGLTPPFVRAVLLPAVPLLPVRHAAEHCS